MSIEGIPLMGLSASALLGMAVLFLLLGKIVPRATLVDAQNESEKWRLAYEREREARKVTDAQINELMELSKTTQAVIAAMFQTTGPIYREAGDPNGSPVANPKPTAEHGR